MKITGGERRVMSEEASVDSVERRAEIQRPGEHRDNIVDERVKSKETNSQYSKVNFLSTQWTVDNR